MFKLFLIWSSGGPRVQWSGTIYAILKEDIMRRIHVKFMKYGEVVQEEMSFKENHTDVRRRTRDKDRLQYLTLSLRLR